jgi:hypothetical protein
MTGIFIIFLLFPLLSFSQTPEKFKYQAVIRNNAGQVIQDQNVNLKISILEGSVSGSVIYSEEHSSTTNTFGLVSLEVGAGSILSGNFSSISWGTDEYFIQIEIDTSGNTNYQLMGITQLLSVPYALYAKESGTTDSAFWHKNGQDLYYNEGNIGIGEISPNGKLIVKSDSSAGVNDVIFSVVNAQGDTVMAVYQEGVRIWVADDTSSTKATGNRGGFAVGGFNPSKTLTNDYLWVTPDSVRVYIEEGAGSKASGNRGGFAVGGFSPSKAFTTEFLRVTDDSSRVWTNGPSGFEIKDLATGSINYFDLSPENYFIGHNSGINTNTGLYNSFIGFQSGYENTSGSDNIFIGYESGYLNSSGIENVFIGNGSGYSNTNGFNNVMIGNWAGYSNDTAAYNVFIGNNAGYANTIGSANVIIGDAAGEKNTIGNSNVFIGDWSAANNTEGEENVFIGNESGWNNTLGNNNIFIGAQAGYLNTSGNGNIFIGETAGYANLGEDNIFIGVEAGTSNTIGNGNLFMGYTSGFSNIDGEDNLFIGAESGYSLIDGYGNTILGNYAGYSNTSGSNNLLIGLETGYMNFDGDSNIFIGNKAGYFELGSNLLYIENSDTDTPLIYGDFASDKVTINDVLILAPRTAAPAFPVEGELYVNSASHHIYCYLNGIWAQLD